MNQLKAVNEKKAAQTLGVAVQTLRNWRHLGKGPSYLKLSGRLVRYQYIDLIEFMRSKKIHIDE